MTGRYCFHRCLSVNISGGGVPGLRFSGGGYLVSDFQGGVPGLRFSGGGYLVSDFWGGYLVSDFWGGYLVSDFQGGYPVYGYTAGGMPLAFTQEDFLVGSIVMAIRNQTNLARRASLLNKSVWN